MTDQTQAGTAGLWFGRDPQLMVSLIVAAVAAIVALVPMNEDLAGAIAGVVSLVGGLVVAFAVKHEGQLPAILGLAKGLMYVLVIAGWNVPDTTQATVLVAIEAVAALFIRNNVVARIGPNGETVKTPVLRP